MLYACIKYEKLCSTNKKIRTSSSIISFESQSI